MATQSSMLKSSPTASRPAFASKRPSADCRPSHRLPRTVSTTRVSRGAGTVGDLVGVEVAGEGEVGRGRVDVLDLEEKADTAGELVADDVLLFLAVGPCDQDRRGRARRAHARSLIQHVDRHDRRAGGFGKFDCTCLHLVARAARAIGREANILTGYQSALAPTCNAEAYVYPYNYYTFGLYPSSGVAYTGYNRWTGSGTGSLRTLPATFTGEGGLSVAVDGNRASVIVDDSGPGIPEAAREAAMEPFQRLDAARDPNRGGGSGLGLAIAADIARSHGGALRLGQSEALGGLRAELTLAR